ncbi:mycofactocin biosynthesis peptidyl-dipeptidase MftE [Salinifilum ghardaiensis]
MSPLPEEALADRSWCELTGRAPTVLLPLGACEQHGPHLPLDTDAAVAAEVARRGAALAAGAADVLVAPAQPYGASGEHEGFPGTVSTGHEALQRLLVEIGRSLGRWAPRLLVVNAHGGNLTGLTRAVAQLRAEGRDVAWWHCSVPGSDAHAGRTETALMSALRPGSVRDEHRSTGRTEPVAELMPALSRHGVLGVSTSGVLGDPTRGTAAEGRAAVTGMAERLAAALVRWSVEDGALSETGVR